MYLSARSYKCVYIRRMLTFDDSGRAIQMDLLLRQCLREFPYPHLALLKQMVSSLAKTTPVSQLAVCVCGGPCIVYVSAIQGEQPTAYTLLVSVAVGDKG